MLVGLVAVAPFVVLGPGPGRLSGGDVAWLVVGGVGNAGGLLIEYAGLRIGKVGVVAPIASTEGAIAAGIAILAGGTPSRARGLTPARIVARAPLPSPPPAGQPRRGGARGPA